MITKLVDFHSVDNPKPQDFSDIRYAMTVADGAVTSETMNFAEICRLAEKGFQVECNPSQYRELDFDSAVLLVSGEEITLTSGDAEHLFDAGYKCTFKGNVCETIQIDN